MEKNSTDQEKNYFFHLPTVYVAQDGKFVKTHSFEKVVDTLRKLNNEIFCCLNA